MSNQPILSNQQISPERWPTAMVAPLLTLEHCLNVAILGGGDGGVLH